MPQQISEETAHVRATTTSRARSYVLQDVGRRSETCWGPRRQGEGSTKSSSVDVRAVAERGRAELAYRLFSQPAELTIRREPTAGRLKTSRVEWLRIASGTLTQEAWPSSGPTQSSSETRGLAAHTGSRWSRGLRSRKPIAQRDRQLTQDHPLEDRRNPICAHRLARWLGARRSTSCIRSSDRVLRGWQHLWPPTASHTARRTTSSDPPRRSLCRQPVRR